jgi:hypothetical protein
VKSRIVGTGCLALAAVYTASLAFWWPRAGELASITLSPSAHWLLRLLALKLVVDTVLVVPTAFIGLQQMFGSPRRTLLVWMLTLGLLATVGPFVSYLTTALPLYLSEGVWLRFGPQNDFGIGMALATSFLQVMLLSLLLRDRAVPSVGGTLAVSH